MLVDISVSKASYPRPTSFRIAYVLVRLKAEGGWPYILASKFE